MHEVSGERHVVSYDGQYAHAHPLKSFPCIFTVAMVQHVPIGGPAADGRAMKEGDNETSNLYFNFVDLAGSERQKRTQAEGKRLRASA